MTGDARVLGRNMLSMSGLSLFRSAVQFGINVAVAAFVTPGEYGLVAFTAPFLILAALLTDMGLSTAITRAPHVGEREGGAAWVATSAGGLVAAGALALAAGPIERATAMTGLAPVLAIMGLAGALTIAAAVPRAMLERELRYGRVARVEALAIAVAAALGLGAAAAGAGVWALVGYNLLNQALRAAAFGWSARRALAPDLATGRLRPFVSVGGWVLATNLLNFVARYADNLLIGAALGAVAVGVYGWSYQFMLVPLMAITWPTSGILVATLRGRDLHDPAVRTTVAGVIAATAAAALPAMAFATFALAWPVEALLSERWRAVPAIVAWLAPAGAIQSLASYCGALLLVAGRVRTHFALTAANAAVLLATFLLALPWGLMALVRSYALVTTVNSCLLLAVVAALTGLGGRVLARALAPALAATGAGVIAALAVGTAPRSWGEWFALAGAYGGAVAAMYALLGAELRRAAAALRRLSG